MWKNKADRLLIYGLMLLFCLYKQRVHNGVVGVQCGKGMVSLRFRMDSADLDIDFIDLQIIRIIIIGVVFSNYVRFDLG